MDGLAVLYIQQPQSSKSGEKSTPVPTRQCTDSLKNNELKTCPQLQQLIPARRLGDVFAGSGGISHAGPTRGANAQDEGRPQSNSLAQPPQQIPPKNPRIVPIPPGQRERIQAYALPTPQLETSRRVLLGLGQNARRAGDIGLSRAAGAGAGSAQRLQGDHALLAVLPTQGEEIADQFPLICLNRHFWAPFELVRSLLNFGTGPDQRGRRRLLRYNTERATAPCLPQRNAPES